MKISQRKAAYYRKRCMDLERTIARQKERWTGVWNPGWVHIKTLHLDEAEFASISTARKLGHAVVVVEGSATDIRLYADKL